MVFLSDKKKCIRERSLRIRQDLSAVFYAYCHPDLPLLPKILIFIALGYALSPVDLIPDFIPVLGYLDDLIIVPSLIALSLKFIPGSIIEESRAKAAEAPASFAGRWLFAVLVILMWLAVCGGIAAAVFFSAM